MIHSFFKKSLSIACIFSFFLSSMSNLAFSQTNTSSVQVLAFNILAPCYASSTRYPMGAKIFLERNRRREKIIQFLNSISPTTDIIALQETTQTEFQFFQRALENNFLGFEVYHDAKYWADWILPDETWEPNGVAIFVRKSSFKYVKFQNIALSNRGNHSAYFEATHRESGLKFRGASIHLDSDHDLTRHQELKSLLNFMRPEARTRDIIAGDFNNGTHNGVIKLYLSKNQFVDVLRAVGREEWTSPYSDDWYRSKNLGIIDHIVVRNAKPIDGQVFNFSLWDLYPDSQDKRILASLEQSGSDHFPVLGVFDIR